MGYLGATAFDGLYVGADPVDKLYVGADLAWQAIDPLLAEADWYIDGGHQTGAGITDLVGSVDLTAVADAPDPKPVQPAAWTGDALVGSMRLDGGYDDALSWPTTGIDVSATFSVLPVNDPGLAGWAELFHIPTADDTGATEYIEFAVVFDLDGDDVFIGLDFQLDVETDPTYTCSAPICTKTEGIGEHTWRLTGVFATGVMTLYKDGVQFHQETFEPFTMPEPDAGVPVQVGPFQHLTPLKSTSLKDDIGGAEIIGWDADTPTGWTAQGSSWIGPAPTAAAFVGGDSMGWTAPDPAFLNIGADDSLTGVISGRIPVATSSVLSQFAGAPGYILDVTGGALRLRISSGGAPLTATWAAHGDDDDHVWIFVLDRVADTMTVYTDGVEDDEVDFSALGAVDSAATFSFLSAYLPIYRAAFYRGARTDIAELTVAAGA